MYIYVYVFSNTGLEIFADISVIAHNRIDKYGQWTFSTIQTGNMAGLRIDTGSDGHSLQL